jgi:hypothetical protein
VSAFDSPAGDIVGSAARVPIGSILRFLLGVGAVAWTGLAPIAAAPSAPRPVALVNGTVIDGRGGPARSGMTVLLRDGRIEALLDAHRGALPTDAQPIDVRGQYILPGLIDAHVHLPRKRRELEQTLALMLQGGITSVRDMAGDAVAFKAVRRRQEEGVEVPTIYYSAFFAGPAFFPVDKRIVGSTQGRRPGSVASMLLPRPSRG